MRRAVIVREDGVKEWVDPIVSLSAENDDIIINNGVYDYKYDINEIKSISFEEL